MTEVTSKDDYVRCRYCDISLSINEPSLQSSLKELPPEEDCRHKMYEFQCPACAITVRSFRWKADIDITREDII